MNSLIHGIAFKIEVSCYFQKVQKLNSLNILNQWDTLLRNNFVYSVYPTLKRTQRKKWAADRIQNQATVRIAVTEIHPQKESLKHLEFFIADEMQGEKGGNKLELLH